MPSRSKTPTASSAFDQALERYRQRVEEQLDAWLPPAHIHPARLHEAMRYSVLGGGKRIRPILVYAAGEALGVAAEHLDALRELGPSDWHRRSWRLMGQTHTAQVRIDEEGSGG